MRRSRGVSHVAVLKAAKTGQIPLEADGSIDPAKADAAWDRSTDPGKAKGTAKSAPKPTKPAPEAMKTVAEAAVGSNRETLEEEGLPASSSVAFVQARTAYLIARARLARSSHRQILMSKLTRTPSYVPWMISMRP